VSRNVQVQEGEYTGRGKKRVQPHRGRQEGLSGGTSHHWIGTKKSRRGELSGHLSGDTRTAKPGIIRPAEGGDERTLPIHLAEAPIGWEGFAVKTYSGTGKERQGTSWQIATWGLRAASGRKPPTNRRMKEERIPKGFFQ